MRILIKNKSFLTLSGSSVFQALGISFFNIILIMFARSFGDAKLWITLISIFAVLPGIASVFLGRSTDLVSDKAKVIIYVTFIQSLLFFFMALFIGQKYNWVILTVILINLISDLLGTFVGLLKYPIIQEKINSENRREALGLIQSVSVFMQPVGQALGVAYIGVTGDYKIGSLINAITFFVSGIIFLIGYRYVDVKVDDNRKKETNVNKHVTFKESFELLSKATDIPIFRLLSSVVLLNAACAGIDGILNLYILDNIEFINLNFGLAILLVNISFISGQIVGSIWVHDIFLKWSFKKLLLLASVITSLLFFSIDIKVSFYLILVLMFCLAYIMGKTNPKVATEIMDNVDSNYIGPIMGIVTSLMTIATPIGSVLLVGGYSVIGVTATLYLAMFLAITSGIIIMTGKLDN